MIMRRVKRDLMNEFSSTRFDYILRDDDSLGYEMNVFIFGRDKFSHSNRKILIENRSLDDFALSVFRFFALGKKPEISIRKGTRFNPLYSTSEEEIRAFLKLHRLKEGRNKIRKSDKPLLDMLHSLEERRPGAMLSIVSIGRRIGLI